MPRTTPAQVQQVLMTGGDYDLRKKPSLVPFIAAASSMVDDVVLLAATKLPSFPPSLAKQELIERWLAAHFYQQSDKGYTSRSTAGASGSFQGKIEDGFASSLYGQTALRLDTSGCLAVFDKRAVAAMAWGGKTQAQSLTFDERM